MTESEQNQKLGEAVAERRSLKCLLGCIARKADTMEQSVLIGMRLIRGETSGKVNEDGELFVSDKPKPYDLGGRICEWPTREDIAQLAAEREEAQQRIKKVESQLREMGYGD